MVATCCLNCSSILQLCAIPCDEQNATKNVHLLAMSVKGYTAAYGPYVAFFGHRLLKVMGVIFASHISSSNIKFLVYMTRACEVGWNLLFDIIPINHPIIVRSMW